MDFPPEDAVRSHAYMPLVIGVVVLLVFLFVAGIAFYIRRFLIARGTIAFGCLCFAFFVVFLYIAWNGGNDAISRAEVFWGIQVSDVSQVEIFATRNLNIKQSDLMPSNKVAEIHDPQSIERLFQILSRSRPYTRKHDAFYGGYLLRLALKQNESSRNAVYIAVVSHSMRDKGDVPVVQPQTFIDDPTLGYFSNADLHEWVAKIVQQQSE